MKGKFTYEYLTLKKEKKMEARKIPPTFFFYVDADGINMIYIC